MIFGDESAPKYDAKKFFIKFIVFILWGEGQKPPIYCISKNTALRATIFVPIDSETHASYLFMIHYSALNRLVSELLIKSCFVASLLRLINLVKKLQALTMDSTCPDYAL